MELELAINQYLAAKGIRRDEGSRYRLDFRSVVFSLEEGEVSTDVLSKEADSMLFFYKGVFSVSNYEDGGTITLIGGTEQTKIAIVPEKANNDRTSFECSFLFQTPKTMERKFELGTITGFVKFFFVRIILLP
ncbi:hypothetical protein SAMN05421780_12410 [Flexibacter flexilis DSM 6793]|uniref:Uncharacterized protein n=1 Tax=Flexibacter flexilis DSM 6793 TaxID=927664 RepID=A0A1I1NYT3_9BACT|nr:hypothetical protein [Flexibacter flexilis]SFD02625.1 hypothetical protein SAMN05421780_12410 [Flexibacter flexilis DSM 6793]